MKKFIKKVIYIIAIFLFICFFLGDDEEISENKELIGTSGDPNQTWAIYWYVCGSDLESDGGQASADIEEMLQVKLPKNVKIIIQTGGAYEWENENVRGGVIQRFVYSSEGLKKVDEKKNANMGSYKTLANFLKFAKKNYPADKTMAIFWNHGGGSVAGALFDEVYNDDSLTLEEFYKAFDEVYDLDAKNPPFEIIGFDACLMATIDTAYTFADVAKYLVASEDLEPGGGWNYTGFLNELAKDPGMDGARLGQHICDSYMDDIGWFFEDDATLSVVDLSKANPLFEAYEDLGIEALNVALKDPRFFSKFGRVAEESENYGGNTRYQGYTNMVDLADLTRNSSDLLPKNYKKVINTLNDCVIYQVRGMYHENAGGLSCYYSYNGDVEDFFKYLDQGCSDSFKYLYGYGFVGDLPKEGWEYLREMGYKDKKLPHVPNIEKDGEKDYPVSLDKDGLLTIKLDRKTSDMLKTIYINYAYVDEKNDQIILLGNDNDLTGDFESGIFKDNFRGVWGSIDGHLVYMEVEAETDDYTFYTVPILLNDKEYNLRVVYDYDKEKFKILGARKSIGENGMPDKNMIPLKKGDKITPIHYAMSLSKDDDIKEIKKETFTVTDKTTFKEIDLKDGEYIMMYELVDGKNNSIFSDAAQISMYKDNVDIEILD